jgi:hypothetical protein
VKPTIQSITFAQCARVRFRKGEGSYESDDHVVRKTWYRQDSDRTLWWSEKLPAGPA